MSDDYKAKAPAQIFSKATISYMDGTVEVREYVAHAPGGVGALPVMMLFETAGERATLYVNLNLVKSIRLVPTQIELPK